MVNNDTTIHKRVFVAVPSQYLNFQGYMSWSLLWSALLRWEVIVCFVDIDGIVDYHVLNFLYIITFHIESLFCKSQHGKIEGIWYLQINKAWQVVECAWLDWCNLIRRQRTTKYKLRTKYNDNMRINKNKESRKTAFV
jgi:hypothetical protein